jgi:hypothetical protein
VEQADGSTTGQGYALAHAARELVWTAVFKAARPQKCLKRLNRRR